MATVRAAKKRRAIEVPGSGVGQRRHVMFSVALERVNYCIAAGYYLEAISIEESPISDRLEHRLSHLMGRNIGLETLGVLVGLIRTHETDSTLRNLVNIEIDAWRMKRNAALHEMAKLAENEVNTWTDKVVACRPVASQGKSLFRRVDRRCADLRKAGK